MLLETGIAGHGFKIGLGKSWGLGSVASVINKIWIRTAESDCWEPIPCNEKPIDLAVSELVNRLKDDNKIKQVLKNITEALQVFKSVQDINKKINSVEEHTNRKLQFPESLRNYWTTANNTGLNG
jgi:D-ribose pyranose/furanose isomerase RbsD